MLASIFKPIILWGIGSVVAAGLAGYAVVESYNQTRSEAEIVVEKEMPKVEKSVKVASLPKKQAETKTAEQSAVASAPEHPLPKFDILRVETDGSAVIAGTAPAGSMVEILDGDTIIATEKAGSTNEFVVILDKPLAPGGHDLVIRATLDGGKKLISSQSGIVNIPDGKSELLAMLTEPGKASKLLQLPQLKQEAPKEAPVEASKVEGQPVVEMAEKPEPTPATSILVEAKTEETKIASLEQQPKQAEKAEGSKQIAKVEELAKPLVPVLIQAAEVEGKKIFIAGTGLPGTNVHIYIDGKFLGKTKVGAEGSYVFEGIGGLDAGRHAVRADMVGENSTDVMARAVVSLLHEPVASVKIAKAAPKETMVEKAAETASKTVNPVPKSEMNSAMKKEVAMAAKPEDAKIGAATVKSTKEPMKMAAVEEKVETASDTTGSVAEITTGSSVIIRKGDSLWRVSQRRYGQGVRYTTIFEANRDQIRDPNLIYPGQIFEIPAFKEKS